MKLFLHYIRKVGSALLKKLNGIFAFALYDIKKDEYLIARDHIGIVPLYMGWGKKGTFYVASELKALDEYCVKIEIFSPGHYYSSREGCLKMWYYRKWDQSNSLENEKKNSKKT